MAPRTSRRRAVTVPSDEDETHSKTEDVKESLKPHKKSRLKAISKTMSSSGRNGTTASPVQSPRKPKSTSNAEQGPSKPPGKPIYSFFNAATQKQQAQHSVPAVDSINNDCEVVHDDIDDEKSHAHSQSKTTLSKGSSTALAMRKRKFQRTQSFETDTGAIPAPSASQKFRKTSGAGRVASLSVVNEDKRPWTEQFAPVDVSELAVHKRKVADVRNWLEIVYRGRRVRVLVLKGAAGSGKTATIKLLSKDLGIGLIEWRDTMVSDYSSETFVPASNRFEEFVARAGRSVGLTLCDSYGTATRSSVDSTPGGREQAQEGLQALLVEEFPNTFAKSSATLQSFRSTILQYLSSPSMSNHTPIPIVMVISETLLSTNTAAADSFTAHRLLGPELIANPYVDVIEFNPVAPTFLTKALETIVVKEARKSGRRRTPGPQVLKHLAEIGDIRSAVSTLEFLCLRGDDGDTWSSKISFSKTKQPKTQPPLTKAEEEALRLISNRESSLGIFHSVGKVVYNKRADPVPGQQLPQPPLWLPHHRRDKVAETDADSLMDELGTDTSTFMAALHENYALSCSCTSSESALDSLSGCMDNLSDSDLLSLDRFSFGTRAFSGSTTDGLRQDDLCFQIGVKGLLFSLPNPVHRSAGIAGNRGDAFRMYYPASLKLWRRKEEFEDNFQLVMTKLASSYRVPASRSDSDDTASVNGVGSWKQNKDFATQESTNDRSDTAGPAQTSSEAKNELLLDRLPYLAWIMGGSRSSRSSALFDQLQSVTRISGTAPIGDDEPEAEDHYDLVHGTEAWATDRPEVDAAPISTSPKKKRIPSKQSQVFEAMSIPVERPVEKLVLEDDDIVDD